MANFAEVLAAGGSQLQPALQPIRDSRTDRLVGVEALAPVADDRLAVKAAVTALSRAAGGDWVAIHTGAGLTSCLDLLLSSGLPRSDRGRVVIDLSAREPIADYTFLNASVQVLRDHGVRIALSDVGSGYASLSRVLQLRPDFVTADPSLAQAIAEDRVKRELMLAVVRIARESGARLTAAGVDSTDDLRAVACLGVDYVKGDAVGLPSTNPAVWTRWSVSGRTRTAARESARRRSSSPVVD
jgi:EAL domain-containing protein (putative c-di-GMP-specific phosphodiesterase class I)